MSHHPVHIWQPEGGGWDLCWTEELGTCGYCASGDKPVECDHSIDHAFDRSLCVYGWMHNYCAVCGALLDKVDACAD